MILKEYSVWVNNRWDNDPRPARDKIAIAAMGITGEAGEVSEPLKKALYSGKVVDRAYMVKELGDLLHYWVRIAGILGISPEEIMDANVEKLMERLPEGHAPVPTAQYAADCILLSNTATQELKRVR